MPMSIKLSLQKFIKKLFENIVTTSCLAVVLLFITPQVWSQAPGCPNVYAGEDVQLDCDTDCTDLTATFLETGETTSYSVGSITYDPPFPFTGGTPVSVNLDDTWSQIIPLPFEFCFYGVNYTQFIIGSNGVVSFDTNSNPPGGFCPWSFSAPIPSPSLISGSINGAYMDIDPSVGGSGTINYAFFGEAPCRTLVVNFPDIPYFGSACVGMRMTSQIVIYETTNVIEVYIEDRPSGCSWNSGNAVIGIQNIGGSQGITPPGRNTGDWGASEEAWRFTPNGPSNVEFVWLDGGGNVIGSDPTITVCPEEDTEYTAQATYIMCDGDIIVTSDTVLVSVCPMAEPDCTDVDFVEDFGTGNGRFETPYTTLVFQPVGQIDGGMYAVSNTTAGMNSGWHSITDHTGNPDGMMFAVNPGFFGQELYRRTIEVDANTDYVLSYWMATVYNPNTFICSGTGDPTNLILRIEDAGGNFIAETNTGDVQNSTIPTWNEYTTNFNSGNNTEVQFIIIDNSVAPLGCGNDFVIDDISVFAIGDQPHAVTPDDLVQCDPSGTTSTFDLTVQIPIILDGQSPDDLNVSFHVSEADASNNANPIDPADAYTNTSNPQTIWVRVEKVDNTDCFTIVNFGLIVNDGIEITTDLPDSVRICDGDEFPALDATPTNPGIDLDLVTYEWYLDGELISEEPILIPTQAGVYTVIITHDGCSIGTFIVEVLVQERPVLDLGEDQLLCDGDSFEIIPFISGTTGEVTYLWNTGAITPTLIVNSSGTYTLEITNGACVVSDSVEILFDYFPDVELGETIHTCPNELVTITAYTSIEDATFTWYRDGVLIEGESGSSITIPVDQSIINTSIYILVEINSNGCVTTDEVEIRAYPSNPACIITQGLSPDDTFGFNDNFDLTFLSNRTGIANLQIINRHGRTVYEKDNYTNEWVGQTNEGEILPTGTYYYVINLAGNDPVYGTQVTGWIYVNRK